MDRITQEACNRQRILAHAEKKGVTDAANRYGCSRKTVYKWKKRYDGTVESLKDQSRAPHHMPRKQTQEELTQVLKYAKRYACDLLLGYEKARANGYSRSYGCFKRTVYKTIRPEKKRRRRKNKPYQRAEYPGEKIQMDVKFVPSYCIANGEKYYQFTAKDECTRWTYREMYSEHSSVSAKDFLEKLVKNAPFPIRMVQTDNGAEFTNALLVTKSTHKNDIIKQLKPTLMPHYFRHNYATMLFEADVEPLIAMKMLSRTDYQTTANIYTHLKSEMLKKSSVNMQEAFRRKQEAKSVLAKSSSMKNTQSRKLELDKSLPWAEKF